ncbi:hypothetical protein V1514DRAFT_330302 [Lipomyces japonicus]|uniref:uncharacterized protein n=1 Tax=Lipomyces japonicus TaxID=56871 RepID=UPI0034CF208E
MKRSQFFWLLVPALLVLHLLLILPLCFPHVGPNVSSSGVVKSIVLGLAGFGILLGLRLFLALFPLSSLVTTSLLLFTVGILEETIHYGLLILVPKQTWHLPFVLGLSWSLAECVVSLYQLVPPKPYRYLRLTTDDDEFIDQESENRQAPIVPDEIDLSLDTESQSLLTESPVPRHHHDHHDHHHHHHHHHHQEQQQEQHPDPASTFSAAAQIHQRQREDPIAPLIGTSLLDLPTYFPFLWRAAALFHHLGFSLLLSLQGYTTIQVLCTVIVVCLYRGILRSVWGIGIMRFGVVTVTFLTLVGGLLSLNLGFALWGTI